MRKTRNNGVGGDNGDSTEGAGAPYAGPRLSRRRLLGGAAALGGASLASLALPPNVQRALAAQAAQPATATTKGSLADIQHVVILMQENRSFDHYFGTLSGVRGFGDTKVLKQSNGKPVFYQPDPSNIDGYLLPYHLNSLTSAAQAIPSTSHAWLVQHSAWNGGAMNNWLPAHIAADGATVGPYTMGYYTEADIPFQFALANAFTVCDNYFCSVLGPTHPNRYMWLTGTIDPNGLNGGPALDNGTTNGTYDWTTYPERLTAAGISWKCYQETDNYGTNVLEFFKQYQTAPTTSPLYKNAMVTQPHGQFEYDAMNDNLPTVSWIFPTSTQSEHPAFLPAAGAAYVASKIDAIAANPAVWAKTVFILNYDENDGLFDHVAPPVATPGTANEFVAGTSPAGTPGEGLPVGPGFRVPCIIVSPWTTGGYVCSDAFDHTSVLQFLESLTGVVETNISTYRRQTFGDLTSAFRFGKPDDTVPVLPDTSGQLALATYETTQFPLPPFPGGNQTFPTQDPGKRPKVG